MKKIIALMLAVLMLASLTACGGSAADDGKYTIGICQLVTHDALDAATEGFMQAVKDQLGEENVVFDLQNAAGDANTCASIANAFVAAEVDLILANATPALQNAQAATADIPILGTSVTEYSVALDLKDFTGTVGGNVSAPPIWRRWRIRLPCCRSGSLMPGLWVCCTAPQSPTPSIRSIPSRRFWRKRATPASCLPLLTPMICLLSQMVPANSLM